jgi:hypothetical protein
MMSAEEIATIALTVFTSTSFSPVTHTLARLKNTEALFRHIPRMLDHVCTLRRILRQRAIGHEREVLGLLLT